MIMQGFLYFSLHKTKTHLNDTLKCSCLRISQQTFFAVLLWPENDNITFGEKNTQQQTKTWSQNCKDLDSYSELPRTADVSWDKRDPDGTENQHAEGDQLSFVEGVGQLPGKKSEYETQDGKDSNVTQNSPESNSWT